MPLGVWILSALAVALIVIELTWTRRFVFRRRRPDGTTEVVEKES